MVRTRGRCCTLRRESASAAAVAVVGFVVAATVPTDFVTLGLCTAQPPRLVGNPSWGNGLSRQWQPAAMYPHSVTDHRTAARYGRRELYLTIEQMKPSPKSRKRKGRRGRLIDSFADLPETPSVDPAELTDQLLKFKQGGRLLKFLEGAILSPAFGIEHAAVVIRALSRQLPSFDAAAREQLRYSTALDQLGSRGWTMLQEPVQGALSLDAAVHAFRGIGILKDHTPQLHQLIAPLGAFVTANIAELNDWQVVYSLWAVAELREIDEKLLDTLLPLLVDETKTTGARKNITPEMFATIDNSLHKLRKEVPYLREVLPIM